MTQRKKKRFIAGASCPECKTTDTMSLFFENNIEKVECVSCGYQMSQPEPQVVQSTRSKEMVIGVFKPE
ncbi:YheV family putative zinc ribbon protein [Alishewanella tabrizica]|uniref:Metal-binding protein n=1 Tax=Alishewanella tabrizica TaxID=671278 RepID=A0ABQ2WQF7_9ALTE|nr:YheV family putative zinc ribbon protein [Alishewanella tabrizica]GGW68477.1 metal-binding protein [Alishewanella tabrizica]